MFSKLNTFLRKLATPVRLVLLGSGTVIYFLFFATGIPDGLARLLGYKGKPEMFALETFDLFNRDKTFELLSDLPGGYGDTGRRLYLYLSLIFDIAFPLLYVVFMASFLVYVLGKLNLWSSQWQKLLWLPPLAGIVDLLENASIYALIFIYPNRLNWLLDLKIILTTAKWTLIAVNFAAILTGLVILVLRKRENLQKVVTK
ncbi:MAG TPA: hypothetical protein VH186_11710 [Chloroflexia bacterium]|nr:hypothetical protein [Chloroflexia bacterium]